jgi:hypothetical protein
MTYFIFIKYLRSLEKFRKKSHVKIPPKSPCANLQSLDIFKNQILFGKEFSSLLAQPAQQPAGPSGLSAQPQHSFFPFQPAVPPPPLPTGPRPLGRPSSPHGPTGHLLPPPAPEPNAQGAAVGQPRTAPTVDPDASTGRKKWPHQSPFIPPLIGAIPLLQSLVTGTFNPGPLKLLQRRPLKALGLPRLASAL